MDCPPNLLSFIKSFHDGSRSTVQYDGSMSEAFDINSGLKQGCVLAPTLFNIFFSVLLKHAFKSIEEGILLRTRSDGKLFKPTRLRAKTKVRKVIQRDCLFTDDDALVAHSAEKLQSLLNQFSSAFEAFRRTISLKKTNVMCQGNKATPAQTSKTTPWKSCHSLLISALPPPTTPVLMWSSEKELVRLQPTWKSFLLECGRTRN